MCVNVFMCVFICVGSMWACVHTYVWTIEVNSERFSSINFELGLWVSDCLWLQVCMTDSHLPRSKWMFKKTYPEHKCVFVSILTRCQVSSLSSQPKQSLVKVHFFSVSMALHISFVIHAQSRDDRNRMSAVLLETFESSYRLRILEAPLLQIKLAQT